uniref:hypothetical protein n=1 Tax=Scytonema sp. HK-05 TaxID=1137095 RepID=UPI001E3CB178|nr:hypothetical protein [Scytonema sp. HK-05]
MTARPLSLDLKPVTDLTLEEEEALDTLRAAVYPPSCDRYPSGAVHYMVFTAVELARVGQQWTGCLAHRHRDSRGNTGRCINPHRWHRQGNDKPKSAGTRLRKCCPPARGSILR